MSGEAKAIQPEDVTPLVAERLNAGDAAGVAAPYEPGAVLAYPADRPVTGRAAIQAIASPDGRSVEANLANPRQSRDRSGYARQESLQNRQAGAAATPALEKSRRALQPGEA
jgi:hypothetical protein